MKPFAWSYTALIDYETCPHAYAAKRVYKTVKDEMSPEGLWGNEVHKKLEQRLVHGTPLPADIPYEKWAVTIERFREPGDELKCEMQMALNRQFKPTGWFAKDAWCRGIIDVMLVKEAGATAYIFDWKGLDVTTPIPTPSGWTTMGELKTGDMVFGGDGKPCKVTGKSAVHSRPCYRIEFDDKSTVICDDEHRWPTREGVMTTKEIVVARSESKNVIMPTAQPVDLPEAKLPIHPYVLGFWLADGKHTSGEICKPDNDVWEQVKASGYDIGSDYNQDNEGRCRTHTVYGLRTQLRKAGLLGNKHIPEVYLRASHDQRAELLRGLMDGDGTANTTRSQCVFTTCDKALSDQVVELLLSLGHRPSQATTKQFGFGERVTAYPIAFRPMHGIETFHMKRKAEKTMGWGPGHSERRYVTTVELVPTVPTQCIEVDSPDNTYLCTKRMLVTHNTGKVKTDQTQLKLFVGILSRAYPDIERFITKFVWLKHDKVTPSQTEGDRFLKEWVPDIWKEIYPRVKRMEDAYNAEVFPMKPNGLCGKYCPVITCPHNGRHGK